MISWLASPVPIRTTGERQSPCPTLRPENVSPNTDTSLPLGAMTDGPRSAHVTPQRFVSLGPVRSTTLPLSSGTVARVNSVLEAAPQALWLADQRVLVDRNRQRLLERQRERLVDLARQQPADVVVEDGAGSGHRDVVEPDRLRGWRRASVRARH